MTKIKPIENTPEPTPTEILIPIPLRMALRGGADFRPLRLYVLKYCRENRISGYKPFKEAEVDYHHNELYDENGNLKPDEPESTANKNLSSLKESKK